MCLCWNNDGTMCVDPVELRRRIDLHMKGEYMPELKKLREQWAKEREEKQLNGRTREEYRNYLNEKYQNYDWPWKRKCSKSEL